MFFSGVKQLERGANHLPSRSADRGKTVLYQSNLLFFLLHNLLSALSSYGSEPQRLICGVHDQGTRVWYSAKGREILRPTPLTPIIAPTKPDQPPTRITDCFFPMYKVAFQKLAPMLSLKQTRFALIYFIPFLKPFSFFYFSWLDSTPIGPRPLLWGFLDHSQLDTPHPIGLVWTSDRPVAETSTAQHTRQTSVPGRDSNPQSQQSSGHRPTP